MGIVRMGAPEELLRFMQREFGLDVFIETGTYRGDTAVWASQHFKTVHTIEFSKELFDETAEKYRCRENIHFIYGNSPEKLAEIVRQLDAPAVFWLDAHHCSSNTAGRGLRAPVLEELDAIALSKEHHFILIDDARLFLAPPPDPHSLDEYPDICTLLGRINRLKKYYILIYDDVIICAPEPARNAMAGFCKTEITQIDKLFWASKSASQKSARPIKPLSDVRAFVSELRKYLTRKKASTQKWQKFMNDFRIFEALNKKDRRLSCNWADRYPCLDDATETTDYNRHYVLHPAWAMRILAHTKPLMHVDISSTLRFVAQLSCLVPVQHYDFRPPLINIDNLECGQLDLASLPFEDCSIESLSCMHTVEHIGLGRYGDALDSAGDIKAARELARVLSPGGNLLFVVPVGRPKIAFNAHRIYAYRQVLDMFPSLQLKQYALIPDAHETGDILYDASAELTDSQHEGCGCFWFTR